MRGRISIYFQSTTQSLKYFSDSIKYYILSNGGSKTRVLRYSIIFNSIFLFLRYWVNKLHPVEIEIIVQIEFLF